MDKIIISPTNYEFTKQAVDELHGKDIGGHVLFVARAQKRAEREAELKEKHEKLKQERMSRYHGVNLYVKNIDDKVTSFFISLLQTIFSSFSVLHNYFYSKKNTLFQQL